MPSSRTSVDSDLRDPSPALQSFTPLHLLHCATRCLLSVAHTLLMYYSSLLHFTLSPERGIDSFPDLKHWKGALCHTYSLAKTLQLMDARHYRAPSLRQDMLDNFNNVAIPGTGIPMSAFFRTQLTSYVFVFLGLPCIAFVVACYEALHGRDLPSAFSEQLLDPQHWFSIWRLNSLLAAWHDASAGTQPGSLRISEGATNDSRDQGPNPSISHQYSLESKDRFLMAGKMVGVPVSPFLDGSTMPRLVAKHKSVEGGMAIHLYDNFTHGGDWILQEALDNVEEMAALLPPKAPLSTLRVITASRSWLNAHKERRRSRKANKAGRGAGSRGYPGGPNEAACGKGRDNSSACTKDSIEVLTTVWRAGRAGASTDHSGIMFDVDRHTGIVGVGRSNSHWYRVGAMRHALRPPSYSSTKCTWTVHPDTGKQVSGTPIPKFETICGSCTTAHSSLMPDVPLVGWDVAVTPKGVFLLEANISCNFFTGSYEREGYLQFMMDHFRELHASDKEALRSRVMM